MKIIHVPSRREETHQKTGENLKEEKSPLKNSRYPLEERRPLKRRRVWMKSGSRQRNKGCWTTKGTDGSSSAEDEMKEDIGINARSNQKMEHSSDQQN